MSYINVVDKQYPGGDIDCFSYDKSFPYIYTGKLSTSTGMKIGAGRCILTSAGFAGSTLDVFFSPSGSGTPSDGRAVVAWSGDNKYERIYKNGKYVDYNDITDKPEVSSSSSSSISMNFY